MRPILRQFSPPPLSPASKLLVQLYIGTKEAATSRPFILAQKITHMVNCCAHRVPNLLTVNQCSFLSLYMNEDQLHAFFDKDDSNITKVCAYIDGALEKEGYLLIHSVLGHNCAMLVAAIYLIHRFHWSADLAIEAVSLCRHVRMLNSTESLIRAHERSIPKLEQSLELIEESLTLRNTLFNQSVRIGSEVLLTCTPAKVTIHPPTPLSIRNDAYHLQTQSWILSKHPLSPPVPDKSILRSKPKPKGRRGIVLCRTGSPFLRLPSSSVRNVPAYIPLSYEVPTLVETTLPNTVVNSPQLAWLMEAVNRNIHLFENGIIRIASQKQLPRLSVPSQPPNQLNRNSPESSPKLFQNPPPLVIPVSSRSLPQLEPCCLDSNFVTQSLPSSPPPRSVSLSPELSCTPIPQKTDPFGSPEPLPGLFIDSPLPSPPHPTVITQINETPSAFQPTPNSTPPDHTITNYLSIPASPQSVSVSASRVTRRRPLPNSVAPFLQKASLPQKKRKQHF
ncbi:putative Polynucleotide 3'-phosphatase / Polynucleotide 5'-hydroxy-kinase [Blattamonas nauphoetae]|uniref:Polynucleotide 3'-phosphatase / Polynucleotide 5'-hydroxy-kinase n=1 Tax=Blattamonas nauphoetae TaxID=2049346 RepID=A0ABQ9WR86_9EUKA|nr:putative Polynucleotide 3'-phosphatase / Polynucleotide 5'-hydroxy-kinase [Blattamonas nauphoetae]